MKYLVDFHQDATEQQINDYISTNNLTVLKVYDNFDKVYVVEGSAEPPANSIVTYVKDDSHVAITPLGEMAEMNQYYGAFNPTLPDITINTQTTQDWWKNFSLGNPEFTEPTTTISRKGKNVSVYLMDSGLMASHPEFVGADITNLYTVTPGNFNDTNGHGTALASVIVGNTCGITQAKLKVVKIFDSSHTTRQSEVLDALDAILNDVLSSPRQLAVVNCSWAISKNEYIESKMRELYNNNILIIAAAGNSGTEIQNVTPASMAEALAVGSYNQNLLPSNFSNYSDTSHISYTPGATNAGDLDGWAPGEQIYTASLNGGYGYGAGTSLSAAIASAIFAYNISDMVYSDGTHVEYLEHENIVELVHWTFRRNGILDLSDPKYMTSVNSIATIIDYLETTIVSPPDYLEGKARVGELSYIIRVYNARLTSALEIVTPLPNNFYISPDGLLTGKPTAAEGPTDGSPYKEYNLQFKRTYNSEAGAMSGTTEDVTVKLLVIGENVDVNTIPEDDPNLDILLLEATCSGFALQACELITGTCPDSCGGGTTCCGSSKFDTICGCVSGGGGTCFSGETLITMADHSTKPMKDIRDGDEILSYNFTTNSHETNIVEHIHIRKDRKIFEYTLSDGSRLVTTDDHPLYVINKGWCSVNPTLTMQGYKGLRNNLVSLVSVGDVLLNEAGTGLEIVSIKRSNYKGIVYTFNNKHKSSPNYYANGILAF